MRSRLIVYHLKSMGNLKLLYQQVMADTPLLHALKKMDIRIPYAAHQIGFQGQAVIAKTREQSCEQLRQIEQEHIQILTIFDANYPKMLKEIFNPPLVLYAKGNGKQLGGLCISVVGSRTPSQEAYPIVQCIIQPLIQNQICIVSGMANGIDTYAHLITDSLQGKTIAVLGGGFHHIYPKSNVNLAEKIQKEHLLLSEYPPNLPPQKWRFVERNRIIAGLSVATVVIEAKERSGSLITAQIALEEGRDVFAVPGSILCEKSVGCNQLIQEGASLICDGKEIIDLYKNRIFGN